VYIDFPPGVDFERSVAQFRAAAGGPDVVFAIVSRSQSATVGNVERISSLPTVLAAMMGLLGVATLAHALTTTIRRRRRDLAIFKTIGLVGRQVRGIVAWQSTALVVTSLLVGLPLGIAAGRWGWRLFAEQLAVVPVPVVPALVVVAVVVGAILAANLIAALPARVAARTQPALVLRTE
jgi:predicted lysophospholipase L1 biosynthesis ABC-type transport system permease subunit